MNFHLPLSILRLALLIKLFVRYLFDIYIFLVIYSVRDDCENWALLKAHKNPVLEIHWSTDGEKLFSASADKDCAIWDVQTGQRLKRLQGHQGIVNSCSVSKAKNSRNELMASASDDGTVKLWDLRARRCVETYEHNYQFLSVALDESRNRIFAGSLDNMIHVLDTRMSKTTSNSSTDSSLNGINVLTGHKDCVTGLDLSNDGSKLLSNGMDSIVRMWDIQPFYPVSDRCIGVFRGSSLHNQDRTLLRVRWSADDILFAAGSACKHVNIFDPIRKRGLCRIPGHRGTIQEVAFANWRGDNGDRVIASVGADKSCLLSEISDPFLMQFPESEDEDSDDDDDESEEEEDVNMEGN